MDLAQTTYKLFGKELPLITEGDTAYIPLRALSRLLGVSYGSQKRRLDRDPIIAPLSKELPVRLERGGTQDMIVLPLEYVDGFLLGLDPSRVGAGIRKRYTAYRLELYETLGAPDSAEG